MKAIQISSHGGTEVLTHVDVPEPRERADRVLVQVEAVGVNFIDTYHRRGIYPVSLPMVPGMEGAGTVVDVGDGVDGVEVGDRVAWAMSPGSYAQMVSLSRSDIIPIPEAVATRTAAAAVLQGLTAHALTHTVAPVATGDTVLVHAAAGGVGQLLVQMARAQGARVIATVGSVDKAAIARKRGASDVIRYDLLEDIDVELPEAVRALTVSQGVHAVFDGVGAATFRASLASLRPRGSLVLFGQASGPVEPFDPLDLTAAGSVTLSRPSLKHFIADTHEREDRAAALFDMITRGSLDIEVSATYPLADAAQAHRDLEGRSTTGKLLLTP